MRFQVSRLNHSAKQTTLAFLAPDKALKLLIRERLSLLFKYTKPISAFHVQRGYHGGHRGDHGGRHGGQPCEPPVLHLSCPVG